MTLQPATITPEKGDAVKAMFNPDLITYTKTNAWNYAVTNGNRLPDGSFAHGSPATLHVTLIFDGTETGENISLIVDKLTKMTKVNDSLPNGTAPNAARGGHGGAGGGAGGGSTAATSQSKQGRPPTVTFQWGTYLSFVAVIQSLSSKFSLFLDDGTAVRATVDLTLWQIADEDAFAKQNPTSGGRTGEQVHRLAPRETLDQVAYAVYGKTSLWRALAAFNGIDDPLRLQAGDAILLPASVDDLKALA
jgi:Contractile injection system tube protein